MPVPTIYRDSGYSLAYMIEDIEKGKIALPDIQRPFVWQSAQVRELFDSMYRGFPVGTLMFWETGADVGVRQVGGGENDDVARLLIVDGQQRLTSLFAVLTGRPVLTKQFQQKRVHIAFRPEDETFEVADAAIRRDPEFIADITVLWSGEFKSRVREFLDRLGAHRGLRLDGTDIDWNKHQDMLEERIDKVRDLRNFRFQVLELSAAADAEQVAEIFVRTNSKGVQLKQADFILTLMSVYWEKGRQQLEQFCQHAVDRAVTAPSPRNAFIDPSPDQLLRAGVGLAFRRGRLRHVYNILRGKDLESGAVSVDNRTAQFRALEHAQETVLDLGNWHEFLKCLTYAGFRSRSMVTSQTALLYTYVLWLIGRRDFGLDLKTLRGVVARWFFMAHTTGRYTNSPETQIEADLGRLPADDPGGRTFVDVLDRLVRSTFTTDYWNISVPNRLDTSSARSPVLSAYQAALNLLDAEALFSDLRIRDLLEPSDAAPRSVERHHLFPRAHLAAKGIKDQRQVNSIANMAYLDWPDNAGISAEDPLAYWPAMTANLDPDRLARQFYWHALPVGWAQLDYPTFLERRRLLMAGVVRDGFSRLWDDEPAPESVGGVTDLLHVGESQTVEFKSTARWNLRAGRPDKRMEHAVVKTVCGFLNAQGGRLLIGVDDNATVIGLAEDLRTLVSKPDNDGYELFLRQLLDNSLSVPTAALVNIGFERVRGTDVCVVSASSSGRPVFAKSQDGGSTPNEFWVRVGNATKQLHGDDMLEYRASHWGT
ncbi:MAG: DUF262 domain-containing protein [Acidimicrobiaceae bacterium]|nr:DUF262 domain-containing protein [Acidimicrobiaceae bacterium]MYE96105.1 DUF262 domain-containing protein [Acidimicrobiaceae bacterium]MYI53879.1 DUF262 domain-containing protein [Acidimicrobiaceae bacterium]